MMDHFNVAVVVHGQTPVSPDLGGEDPYAEPKRQDKFVTIDSGNIVSTFLLTELVYNYSLSVRKKVSHQNQKYVVTTTPPKHLDGLS